MNVYKTDICIIGGGSGGIGAAIGAAKNGAQVILIEKNHTLGGTVTHSWVHTWEPVCGSSELCFRLWRKMRQIPFGASEADYALSCKRMNSSGTDRNPPLPFEPWAFLAAVDSEFAEAGNINVFYDSIYIACEKENRRIKKIICRGPSGTYAVEANVFIDSTDEIYAARDAGCAHYLGADSKHEFNEEHAPEKSNPDDLNEVNWIYRVRPTGSKVTVDTSDVPEQARRTLMFIVAMPSGDMLVNMCGNGTMSPAKPKLAGFITAQQRKLAYDNYRWQVISGSRPDWALIALAPKLGIREGYRLKARRMITENDIASGSSSSENYIAACDHRLDIHGAEWGYELKKPFGITIDSLLTVEFENLIVASRGAGFSHIAAGSCRLSRTIMTLGEAAGKFAAANINGF